MSLGLWPIGTRPIGALRRNGGLQRFAAAAMSGAGLATFVSGPAAGALNAAGAGSASLKSGPASGALNAAGAGTLSGNLLGKGSGVLNAAGAGGTGFALFSQNSAVLATAGAGLTSISIMAKVSSAVTMQGQGGLGSADNPVSIASFAGSSGMVAVIYAFFGDNEIAAPLQEIRVAYAPYDPGRFYVEPAAVVPPELRSVTVYPENRVAVVPFENRVYLAASNQRAARAPNRRRTK